MSLLWIKNQNNSYKYTFQNARSFFFLKKDMIIRKKKYYKNDTLESLSYKNEFLYDKVYPLTKIYERKYVIKNRCFSLSRIKDEVI